MIDSSFVPRRTLVIVLGTAVAVWGFLAVLDVRNLAYSGYRADASNVVVAVAPGSPAEAAGIRAGDRIRSVGGVALADMRAVAIQHRPEIGQTRTVVVERNGDEVRLNLTYAAQTGGARLTSYLEKAVAFLYLGFGVWAYLAAPGTRTALLAAVGLLLGAEFVGGPYISSAGLRNLVGALLVFGVAVAHAPLLDFALSFRRDPAERNVALIYGPAVSVGLFGLGVSLFPPPPTSLLAHASRYVFATYVLTYYALAAVAIVRAYGNAVPQERAARGLNILLLGAILGLGPILVGWFLVTVAPDIGRPVSQYLRFALGVIPIAFALAAVRAERTTPRTTFAPR